MERIMNDTTTRIDPTTRIARTTRTDANTRIDTGLAALRVTVGTVFAAHGAQKLFFFGLAGVGEAFAGMGVPLAAVTGPLVGFVELVGGLALVLGLFTRFVSLGLAAVMVGAVVMVHLPAGFFLPAGAEFVLTLLAAVVALALAGPGAFSLDALLRRRQVDA
jgi:putative oxidoreductase